jgi:hypothetical protein
MADFLSDRASELEKRAPDHGVDVDALSSQLAPGSRARVAALATALRIDALGALREDVTLDQLEDESRSRREANELTARHSEEGGHPLPDQTEEH